MWLGFLPGLLIVAGIGWWDDHKPLSPWLRLVVQGVAALALAAGAGWESGQWLPALLAFGAAMVLVNVWNFMDGINGLASGQAALAALGYAALLTGEWHWLALALLAGCVGFLPFNFPRARIFLGDVGSGALGYVLAALLAAGLIQLPEDRAPCSWSRSGCSSSTPASRLPGACCVVSDGGRPMWATSIKLQRGALDIRW